MADGSIIIDTHIDNEQAQKELSALTKEIKKLQSTLSTEQGKQNAIEKEMADASNAVEVTRTKIAELKAELSSATDVGGLNINSIKDKIRELQAELNEAQKLTDVSNTLGVGDPAAVIAAMERQESIDKELVILNDQLKQQTQALAAQQKVIEDKIATQNKLLDQQSAKADKVAKKYADSASKVETITTELTTAQERAGELAKSITTGGSAGGFASEAMAKASERAQKSMQQFGMRLSSVVRSALVFTVITRALSKLREMIGQNIKANSELSAQLAQLKGAWLTAFQPVWEMILPAMLALMRILIEQPF